MNILALYCDGLCEPTNPNGYACWAWLAKSPEGKTIRQFWGCLGHGPGMSNNLAEYEAVLQALRYTLDRVAMLAARSISVRLHADSQLAIRQITGEYRVNAPHLIALCAEARALAGQLRQAGVPIDLQWIPRELNDEADTLSRRAYREARMVPRQAVAR